MNLKGSYHLYAMTTIIFWSLAFPFTKIGLNAFSPYSLGFLRYLTASVTLIIIALILKIKPPRKKDLPLFALAGGSGFFMYMVTFNTGAAMVSSATGSVIIATAPVLTAVLARFIYNERLVPRQWFGIVIQFFGVIVLTLLDGVLSFNNGILWLLGAALSLSIYNLVQRRLTKKYSPVQTSAYSIFFGTVFLAIFSSTAAKEIVNAQTVSIVCVILLGVFCSAIAYLTWSKAFSKAQNTSQVSNYMFITPLTTSILSFIIINEVPDRATLIGGAIILIGILIFNFGKKKAEF